MSCKPNWKDCIITNNGLEKVTCTHCNNTITGLDIIKTYTYCPICGDVKIPEKAYFIGTDLVPNINSVSEA